MKARERFIVVIQLVILIAIIETLNQVMLKESTGQYIDKYLLFGMIGYVLIAYILWVSFKFEGI